MNVLHVITHYNPHQGRSDGGVGAACEDLFLPVRRRPLTTWRSTSFTHNDGEGVNNDPISATSRRWSLFLTSASLVADVWRPISEQDPHRRRKRRHQ